MKYFTRLVFIAIAAAVILLTGRVSFANENILITPEQLSAVIKEHPVVIVDARMAENYAQGHIPGAVNLPFTSILGLRDDELMKKTGMGLSNEVAEKLFGENGISHDSHIVVYDISPDVAASFVWTILKIYGAQNVQILDGGLRAWEKSKLPVTQEPAAVKPAVFKASPNPEIIVTAEWLNQNRQNIVLLDARSLEEYTGVIGAGHIPDAVFLEWKQLAGLKTSFKSPEKIKETLSAAGVTPDKQIVTYCEIGPKASFLYVPLKMLGYNVKMYWGSMREWAYDPNRPVVKK